MSAMQTYTIHGLTVRSPVRLMARPAVLARTSGPDLTYDLSVRVPPVVTVGADRPLAHVDDEQAGRRWTLSADEDGHVFTAHGSLSARFRPGSPRVAVTVDPCLDPHQSGVLLCGPVLAAASILRGRPLLHSSAVLMGGAAVGFVGPSGAGKTTLARLLADAGHELLSDDALRVELDGDRPTAHSGTLGSRLRRDWSRAPELQGAGKDGRHTVVGAGVPPSSAPLACLARPLLSPDFKRVRATPLAPMEGVLAAASVHALAGIADSQLLGEHFRHVGAVAQRVPVLRFEVPWSSDPRHVVPEALADEVEAVLTDALSRTVIHA